MAAQAFIANAIAVGGGPASGALLQSYLQNTTTPSPLYSNVGLSTPTTNPYVADADGRLDFYFDTAISYTWQITDSTGATVLWEADVVGGILTVTTINGIVIESSWAPPLASPLGSDWATIFGLPAARALTSNVRWFGAVGDGTTDDTTAITAAQTAAAGTGTVLFPDGTYRVTSNLTQSATWAFSAAASIKPDSGDTITVDFTKILAGWNTIFTGDGTIAAAAAKGEAKIAWWGVTGLNTADEYTAVNKAVTTTRAGVRLDWGGHLGRITRIDTALSVSGAYSPYWANVDLNVANVAVGGSVSPKVSIIGDSLGANVALSSNVAVNATQITVASALTVDAFYILQSDQTANGDGVTNRAELIKIRSLASGTTYNLEEPTKSSYTTAGSGSVQLFPVTASLKIDGLLRMRGGSGSTSVNEYGLLLRRLYQVDIPRVWSNDIASCHISSDLCVDSDICWEWGYGDGAANTGQGYFLEIAGGYNIRHGDLVGDDMRHVRTFTHCTASNGVTHSNILGRFAHGGDITGYDMRDAADDSHAGFIETITGDCITNFGAGVTAPEAFVIEHSKAKYGRIIVNGAYQTIALIQPYGHPDGDRNYVEFDSISGSVQGAVADFAVFLLNKSGQNAHTGQSLSASIGALHIESAQKGLKVFSEYGDIIFDIGNFTASVGVGEAIYVQSSAADQAIGTITTAALDDKGTGTAALISVDGSLLEPIGARLNILSGRISKTGTGALYATNDALIVTGPAVKETIDASSSRLSVTGLGGVSVAREALAAARTYYVRTSGDDNSPGLLDTNAGAFATIARAMAVVAALDTNGFDVTVDLLDATWTTPVVLPSIIGGGRLILQGNTGTPANCVISTTSADAVTASGVTGRYLVRGLKLVTTTSGSGLVVSGAGADLSYESMDFGACVSNQIDADFGCKVVASGNYNITAAAARHISAQRDAMVNISSRTLTITGTPAFSTAFAAATRLAYVQASGCTFSGSATGVRYSVTLNSVMDTGGATLPGDSAGSTATGGQYA